MKKFIAFILSLQALMAVSQHIELTGTAIGHPNELVRLICYKDQFSRLDTTLGSTTTDVWGNFSLSVAVEETDYAFLALGLKKGDFYLKPGNNYQFQILDDTIKGSIYDQMPLQFNLDATDGTLNSMIGRFNYEYNVFIYENQRNIVRAKDKSIVNSFIEEMKRKYVPGLETNDTYLENYVTYTLASLEWISKSKPDAVILKEFFVNQKILHKNIAYSDFFRDFFKEYFKKQKLFRYDELVNSINSEQLQNLDSLLIRDDLLAQNDELRELSLMLLLTRNFHNQDVSKEVILHLFKQIELSGKYEVNSEIAKNYRRKLTHLQYGSKAPPVQLADQNGELVQLSDFEGRFVLLDFISTGCNPCYFDFIALQEMQQNLGNKVEIVLVSDGDMDKVVAQLAANNANWTVLNLDENILILESYQVKTFPSYILLNPDATIAMAPAPPPNENLELFINGFIARYQNNK